MHKTKAIMFVLAALLWGVQLGCGGNSGPQGTAPNPFSVITTSLPTGTVGTAYSEPLQAKGGVSPYKWSELSGGSLPPGLTLDANTGLIAGTPSATGDYGPYVFQVIDANGLKSSSASFPLTIANRAASTCSPRGNEAALNASTPYAFLLNDMTSTIGLSQSPAASLRVATEQSPAKLTMMAWVWDRVTQLWILQPADMRLATTHAGVFSCRFRE